MFLLILVSILYCSYICNSLRQPNVCSYSSTRHNITEFYCCFNFVEENDHQCKECEPGTMSTDGKVCLLCPKDKFGPRCNNRCDCDSNRICDTKLGCIETLSVKPTQIPSMNERATSTASFIIETSNLQIGEGEDTTNNVQTIVTDTTGGITTDRNTALLYYILMSGGAVGWVIFWVSGGRFVYRQLLFKRRQINVQKKC